MAYIYPKLPSAGTTTSFVRFSGSGLANCLFVYARAITHAHKEGDRLITPTWFNLSIGPYLRHQKDKRHYIGLFNTEDEISGFTKWWKLNFSKKEVKVIEGLGDYFKDLLEYSDVIANYMEQHVQSKVLKKVHEYDFASCVAVHIRLGDYPENVRVPISWYKEKIEQLKSAHPEYRFLVFSDGTDEELSALHRIENVERVFFGNAIADIFAISKCCFMIGSDSTFSGWGAFLGQVPSAFYRKHYGPVLKDQSKEVVEKKEILW